MGDDVLLNKAAAIERSVRRVREEHAGDDGNLENQTRQDAIVLNLQRACESCIDAAMHLVRIRRLGVPQETREAFDLLASAGLIEPALSERMKKMVGFRNVAIHEYQKLNLDIVRRIVGERLGDFLEFAEVLLRS